MAWKSKRRFWLVCFLRWTVIRVITLLGFRIQVYGKKVLVAQLNLLIQCWPFNGTLIERSGRPDNRQIIHFRLNKPKLADHLLRLWLKGWSCLFAFCESTFRAFKPFSDYRLSESSGFSSQFFSVHRTHFAHPRTWRFVGSLPNGPITNGESFCVRSHKVAPLHWRGSKATHIAVWKLNKEELKSCKPQGTELFNGSVTSEDLLDLFETEDPNSLQDFRVAQWPEFIKWTLATFQQKVNLEKLSELGQVHHHYELVIIISHHHYAN